MGIVTGINKRLDIPHEPGEWMMIRKLSWRQLQTASDARTASVMQTVKAMGGEVLRELQGAREREDVQTAAADPLTGYDLGDLLRAGIEAWSYSMSVNRESIDALDDETARWAGRAILDFNAPRQGDERKNGFTGSI